MWSNVLPLLSNCSSVERMHMHTCTHSGPCTVSECDRDIHIIHNIDAVMLINSYSTPIFKHI